MTISRVLIAMVLIYISGQLGVWVQDNTLPVTIRSRTALDDTVQQGGELKVMYSVTRTKMCDTKVDAFLYDGDNTRRALDTQEFSVSPGPIGDQHFNILVAIPIDATPGPSRYTTIVEYRCNPFQQLFPMVSGPNDVPFTIVPKPLAP